MKNSRFAVLSILWAVVLALLALPVVRAQEPDEDQGPDQDPPGRVARLNYSAGSVSMQPGGEGDWVQAVSNRPLTSGDNLWSDRDSRAELHVGSTAIRMDSETSVTFLDLDDHTIQLKLSQGAIVLRVQHLDDGDVIEVDAPNLAFDIQAAGEYRLDVNGDGTETDATVWHGRGEATGGGASYVVVAGQRARFAGSDQLDHEIDQIPSADDFDNFSFSRDQKEDRSESANYISPEMTGYEDLDDYGHWHYAADYGPVWTPAVAAGWAPYRQGHWAWVGPWGWTWVEDEPWGFAPFHYGRWAYLENSWCWVPGPVVVRPVYAPALVAFVGGGGVSVSIGLGGGVGWFPLGPREVYVPWYRTSRGYVNNVNITNTRVNITQVTNVYNVYNSRTTNVTQINYMNRRSGAVTVVNRETFVNARPVGRNVMHVDERQLAEARVNSRLDVQPVHASVMGAGAPARMRPPAAVINRQVVATRAPAPRHGTFNERPAAVNVRTEAPSTPQSGSRPTNQQRPDQQRPDQHRTDQQRPDQQRPDQQRTDQQRTDQQRMNQQNRPSAAGSDQVPRPTPGYANQPNGGQPNLGQRNSGQDNPERMNQPQQQNRVGQTDRQVPRPSQPMDNARQPSREDNVQPNRPPSNQTGSRPMDTRNGQDYRNQPNQEENQAPRPTVRSAPPVQDRPEMQRSEEQKFSNWQQQQRQRSAPPQQQASRPQQQHAPEQRAPQQHALAPQPKQERSHEDKKK
jgi:hypothetical protein